MNKIGIPSYQDSGSQLLRKYIENVTYILTGSDRDTHSKLGKQYTQELGFEGEGITNHKVWLTHTNFPEEIGTKLFNIQKAIVVCQNPWDAIYSSFCKIITKKLNKDLSQENMEILKDAWEDFITQEAEIWRKFYDFWMLGANIPTFLVRYEDLIQNPKKILSDVVKFMLNNSNIEGTLIENLITREAKKYKELYYSQKTPGFSFKYFSKEQMNSVKSLAGWVIRRLGYGKNFISPINPVALTDFFENDEWIYESKKYELESIVKNKSEIEVLMRYDYVEFNHINMNISTSNDNEGISKVNFLLNHENEKLRDTSSKACLKKYKELIKSVTVSSY